MRTKVELKREKKRNDILLKDKRNLNNKINELENYNKELLSQLKENQIIILPLHKYYSILSLQKNFMKK